MSRVSTLAFVPLLSVLAAAASAERVAAPLFDPAPRTFAGSLAVHISCSTTGATIHYTTDGSTPSGDHGTVIASGGTVTLTATTTLKAIAHKSGLTNSEVRSGTYTKAERVATPTFDPAPRAFPNSIVVHISCPTPGATIRYTTDGSTPSGDHGTVIASGSTVTLTATTTLKAIAYKSGLTNSEVRSGTYSKSTEAR